MTEKCTSSAALLHARSLAPLVSARDFGMTQLEVRKGSAHVQALMVPTLRKEREGWGTLVAVGKGWGTRQPAHLGFRNYPVATTEVRS